MQDDVYFGGWFFFVAKRENCELRLILQYLVLLTFELIVQPINPSVAVVT